MNYQGYLRILIIENITIGWAAVVANLEDIVSAFRSRFENFELSFNEYLKGRKDKFAILENFDEDIKLLARIPVLPALLPKAHFSQHPNLKAVIEEQGIYLLFMILL